MPELPDLEAYSKNLAKRLSGKEVKEVIVFKPRKLNVSKDEINEALVSARVKTFKRDGKEMLIVFDNGRILSVHLMLEGGFRITPDIDSINSKMFALRFDDVFLVVYDPKGWAKMELDPEKPKVPDALSPDFSLEYFLRKLKEKKNKNIKALLIDQSIVRGIGNAYADEILWDAKISPESKAGKIPKEAAERLYASIRSVLNRATEEILQIRPDVIDGEVRNFMRVHNKDRTESPGGYPILTKKIASKTTYFTEEQETFS